ncbi:MAG: carboxypeptidase M32 [Pseudomonadales bacterium]|jgi:carboxypeptidase Taq|nr:carboxypeptidase M32 [Kiritimatiellia bacterium]MDP6972999.1 carboxypeptidase M32 [Pseudomonadales bacterium]
MTAYEKAAEKFAEIHKLSSVSTLLFWDSKTMMPVAGSPSRGEQMGALTKVLHDKRTNPELTDLIAEAEQEHNELDSWQHANVREMKRLNAHAHAVDGDTAVSFARAQNDAGMAWVAAKANNDFEHFAPHLETVFSLQIEIAHAKAEALGLGLYDALLDEHDPGTSTEDVDRLFGELEAFLPDYVKTISARQTVPLPLTRVEKEQQEALILDVIERIGWPADGRLDHTEHPFALAGVPGDPRITTHYDPNNVLFAMMAAFHECGHGMYELNLPKNEYAYQPVGVYRGGSTHESQSLGVEMMACRSGEFLNWLFPRMRGVFGVSSDAWSDDNLLAHYRQVQPSFIRIKADEVTYPLHVILRYNLEQKILSKSLAIADIPEAWDVEMERLLGIRPDSLSNGCLQDVHWSMGLIGYFPTYLLGALKAAQFFDAAKREHANLLDSLREGDFSPWMDWLKENVHTQASLLPAPELVSSTTGSQLETTALLNHFQDRYGNAV